MLICICVNCNFYSTCWINNALYNFPLNYQILAKKVLYEKKNDKKRYIVNYLPVMLKIKLNVNSLNYNREPDIIFCDAFIEKPGKWLV